MSIAENSVPSTINEFTEVKVLKLTVVPKDIYDISWFIDACEGIGFLQTDDSKLGKVSIFTPLSQLQDMKALIEGLKADGL
ncbi:MAG: DUF4911 domain-containing protein, partial [Synergistaceae bacterium]